MFKAISFLTITKGILSSILIGTVFLEIFIFCSMVSADNGTSKQDGTAKSLGIGRYMLQAGPIKIGRIWDNASGLSFNPLTRSLFVVFNRPAKIVEIDTKGMIKRNITLYGFSDPEGITHINDNMFAVVEEKRGTIGIIEIDQNTTTISRSAAKIITVDSTISGNKGLEGVTYDPVNGLFYVVKEKNPRNIYQFSWPVGPDNIPKITHPWNIQQQSPSLKDISDIYFHPDSGNLLILSDESGSVTETTVNGKKIDQLTLNKGDETNLQRDIPQAEGITMDNNGTLFICSEPNLLYIFKIPIQ